MKAAIVTIACACALALTGPATAQDFDAQLDAAFADYDEGYALSGSDPAAAVAAFERGAHAVESLLAATQDTDQATREDLHKQAGTGWYYAGENYHALARGASDDETRGTYHAQMVDALSRAIDHLAPLFAGGEARFQSAEYYFAASFLVEHGREHGDPRTEEWSEHEVTAARQRVVESELLGLGPPWPAKGELAVALAIRAEVTGDEVALAEARAVIEGIPEENRNRRLRAILE